MRVCMCVSVSANKQIHTHTLFICYICSSYLSARCSQLKTIAVFIWTIKCNSIEFIFSFATHRLSSALLCSALLRAFDHIGIFFFHIWLSIQILSFLCVWLSFSFSQLFGVVTQCYVELVWQWPILKHLNYRLIIINIINNAYLYVVRCQLKWKEENQETNSLLTCTHTHNAIAMQWNKKRINRNTHTQ